jgi:hypothetical protein
MAIKFYKAADKRIGSYTDGVPGEVQVKILAALDAIDAALPGIRMVAGISELGIVYDPKNRHGAFSEHQRGRRGAYYWPLHLLYLGDSGIKKSITHELAHMLDILAGPTENETQAKFGQKVILPRSVYYYFPQGGRFFPDGGRITPETVDALNKHFDEKSNFIGWLTATAIVDARLTREDQRAKENMKLYLAEADINDPEMRFFIAERVADLADEYVYTFQVERGMEPLGVSGERVFSNPKMKAIWWGREWIKENEARIKLYFDQMLVTILERNDAGKLKARLDELHSKYVSVVDILLGEDHSS